MMRGLFEQEGYDLMAAAFEVYNEMGNGFLEDVYQECFEMELGFRNMAFEAQPHLPLTYKGHSLDKRYRPDLIVVGEIIVELKAIKRLGDNEYAQILNYLKATGKRVGYLINFGSAGELEWNRFVV
jgi:GxxExxY protein